MTENTAQVKAPARPILHAASLKPNGADYFRGYHHIQVPHTVTVADILRPGFWAHHVSNVNINDLIDIVSDDGGLDMQVRVTGKGIGMVNVRPLRIWQDEARAVAVDEPDASDEEVPEGYSVTFAPKQRWRVMTDNPPQIISKDHPTKSAAIAAAVAHSTQANAA